MSVTCGTIQPWIGRLSRESMIQTGQWSYRYVGSVRNEAADWMRAAAVNGSDARIMRLPRDAGERGDYGPARA